MGNMTKLIFRYRWEIFSFLLISAIYILFRLPNLTLQPIFADEAIYIRWAQIMRAEPTLRFISVMDGKTPLFMWILMPFLKIFDDPLFAGRLVSVLSGYLTMLGVFFLGWRAFNLKAAFGGAFLVAITPFMVFFDRMALVDSMLAAFSIWSLNLALLLIKHMRLDLAMFLGYSLGAALLTKSTGMFNIITLPLTLAIFNWAKSQREQRFLRIFGLWTVAVIIAFAMYNILRLGPGFSQINSRNQDYVFSPIELVGRPLDPFLPHLDNLINWFPLFFTWPILILVILGVSLVFVKRQKYGLAILLWSLIPLIIQMSLLKVFTARYILSSIPPLLCLGAWAMVWINEKVKINNRILIPSLLAVLLILPVNFNYYLLTDPAKSPLPLDERRGYLEDWTAGYGMKEISEFLMEKSKQGTVIVGTEGYFGTLPDGLQIYLDKYNHQTNPDKKVIIIGGSATISAQIRDAAKTNRTYFVSNKSRLYELSNDVKLLKEYPKIVGKTIAPDAILLYQVLSAP